MQGREKFVAQLKRFCLKKETDGLQCVCTDENEGLIAFTVKGQGGFLQCEAYSSAKRELMEDVEF